MKPILIRIFCFRFAQTWRLPALCRPVASHMVSLRRFCLGMCTITFSSVRTPKTYQQPKTNIGHQKFRDALSAIQMPKHGGFRRFVDQSPRIWFLCVAFAWVCGLQWQTISSVRTPKTYQQPKTNIGHQKFRDALSAIQIIREKGAS
jgi:hypothetical protein